MPLRDSGCQRYFEGEMVNSVVIVVPYLIVAQTLQQLLIPTLLMVGVRMPSTGEKAEINRKDQLG